MSLFSYLKHIIKDTIDDFKYLFVIIKKVFKKEPIIENQEKFDELKRYMVKEAPKEIITKNWYWLIAIIFAIVIGFFISAKYYQMQCNNLIVENLENWKQHQGLEKVRDGELPVSPFVTEFPSQESEQGSYG